MSTLRITIMVALGALIIGMACSSVPPVAPVRPVTSSCIVGAAQVGSSDTVSIATMTAVDWTHVPEATNAAERFAFAQAYETLIDADCEGEARPALAGSWTLDATKTRVTFTLRHGAMYWSGKPVTANDVLAAWRETAAQSTSSARLAREIAARTTVVDDNTLIVSLPDTSWMVLASPALAIYEPQSSARSPNGTGPYRVVEASGQGEFVLMPSAAQSAPYVVSRRVAGGDPRDAIDVGSDVLVTDDPVAVGYAKARTNLLAVPLPWTRTYALAVAGGTSKIVSQLTATDSQSTALRESLARDAVRVAARAAQAPYWWNDRSPCGATLDSLPAQASDQRSNRVVYRRDDRIARGLAERIVALDPHTVAAGLAPNDFGRALERGDDLAYVVELPRRSLSSCEDLAQLRSAAQWLASADAKLVPLIDTRQTAILNRNRVSATVDWSGTLHFSRP